MLVTISLALTSIFTTKSIASNYGPSELLIYSQVFSLISFFRVYGSLGISKGVLTRISVSKSSNEESSVLSTALFITIVVSVALSITLYLFHSLISTLIFGELDSGLLKFLSLFIFCWSINSLALSYYNGKSRMRPYESFRALIFVLPLIIVSFSSYVIDFSSAIKLSILPSIILTILWLYVKRNRFQLSLVNKQVLYKLLSYSLTAIFLAINSNVLKIYVRSLLQNTFTTEIAGLIEGSVKYSTSFTAFMLTGLGIFIAPRIVTKSRRFIGYRKFNLILICFSILLSGCALVQILFFEELVQLLLSSAFIGMKNIFATQIIADLLKGFTYGLAAFFLLNGCHKVVRKIELMYFLLYLLLFHGFIDLFNTTVKGMVEIVLNTFMLIYYVVNYARYSKNFCS